MARRGRKRHKNQTDRQRKRYVSKFYNLLDIPLIPFTVNLVTQKAERSREDRAKVKKSLGSRLKDPRILENVTLRSPKHIRSAKYKTKRAIDITESEILRLKICRKRYGRRAVLFALRKIGLGKRGAGSGKREIRDESKVRC